MRDHMSGYSEERKAAGLNSLGTQLAALKGKERSIALVQVQRFSVGCNGQRKLGRVSQLPSQSGDYVDSPISFDLEQMVIFNTLLAPRSITHLIQYALEATLEDGEVRVTLRCNGSAAEVKITDTGSSMRRDFIHSRLFKRFGTTKLGKGMGTGVYLSREYINELGGTRPTFYDLIKKHDIALGSQT